VVVGLVPTLTSDVADFDSMVQPEAAKPAHIKRINLDWMSATRLGVQ